jgi:hypothetical protein
VPKITVGHEQLTISVLKSAHSSAMRFVLTLSAKKGHPIPRGQVKVIATETVSTVVKIKGRSETKTETRLVTVGSGSLRNGVATIEVPATSIAIGTDKLTVDYVGNATYRAVEISRSVKIVSS